MRRVMLKDITPGMVTAERVTDFRYNILLEANVEMTENHIAVLNIWDVDFIRIRENSDTEDSLRKDLIVDRELHEEKMKKIILEKQLRIKEQLGINEENITSILQGQGDSKLFSQKRNTISGPMKMSTLLKEECLKSYMELAQALEPMFSTDARKRSVFLNSSGDLAEKVTKFVLETTGVVGYCLYPYQLPQTPLIAHTLRTSIFAGKIAQLLGYSRENLTTVVLGALLHDIGCTTLPNESRSFDQASSKEEEQNLTQHIMRGLEILKDKRALPKEVLVIVGSHHEHMDGSGYPLRLTGESIHEYARIVALANAVDLAINPLNPKVKPLNLQHMIECLLMWTNQFDGKMCMALQKYLIEFLMSNRITLNDGRVAEIVWKHTAYKQPVVRANDGEIIDLNKVDVLNIESYFL